MGEPRSRTEEAIEIGGWTLGLIVVVSLFAGGIWLLQSAAVWFNYEPTWQWWLGAYLVVGLIIASLSSLAIFVGSWWWSADKWGGICFVLGWLPASIMAVIAWPFIVFLWAPIIFVWYWSTQ
jgi:hypothetical protein